MSDSDSLEHYENLNVSNKWKERFYLLNHIGADEKTLYAAMRSPEFKELNSSKQSKLIFNMLGFLFGPFYYFTKKMWAKGAFIFGAATLFNSMLMLIIEVLFSITPGAFFYMLPAAVIYAQMANYDYFRQVLYGERIWGGFPKFLSRPLGAVWLPVIAIALQTGLSTFTPEYTEYTENQKLAAVSGVWSSDVDNTVIEISLVGRNQNLTVAGHRISVIATSVDSENDIVTVGLDLPNRQPAYWAIRQIFYDDGSFTLQLTRENGMREGLSFIRPL